MRAILATAALFCIAACTPLQDSTFRIAKDVKEGTIRSLNRAEYLLTYHPEPTERKPIRTAYCYRVMQDITCHDAPQPGAEARLVAYQGDEMAQALAGEPSPVMLSSAPPAPAGDHTLQSMERYSDLEPLFIPPPPEVREEFPPP